MPVSVCVQKPDDSGHATEDERATEHLQNGEGATLRNQGPSPEGALLLVASQGI